MARLDPALVFTLELEKHLGIQKIDDVKVAKEDNLSIASACQ